MTIQAIGRTFDAGGPDTGATAVFELYDHDGRDTIEFEVIPRMGGRTSHVRAYTGRGTETIGVEDVQRNQ